MTTANECQNDALVNGRYCDNPAEWRSTTRSVLNDGSTFGFDYCTRCRFSPSCVTHRVDSWAKIEAPKAAHEPAPFTLDGDDPLARVERAFTSVESAQPSLFSLYIDRKPSKSAKISEPTFMDWLDANPA